MKILISFVPILISTVFITAVVYYKVNVPYKGGLKCQEVPAIT